MARGTGDRPPGEMAVYLVALRGVRRVEGSVTIVANSPEEARAIAAQAVDTIVAERIEWEMDYDAPVVDIEVMEADAVE